MYFKSIYNQLIDICLSNNKITIFLFFLFSIISLNFSFQNLKIITDTNKLIDENLEFRKEQKKLKDNFPVLSNNIVLVLEGNNKEKLALKSNLIIEELKKNKKKIDFFYSPNTEPFYKKHFLKIIDNKKREKIINDLYSFQPFLSEINNNPKLKGFNNLLELSLIEYKTNKETKSIGQFNIILKNLHESILKKTSLNWNSLLNNNKEQFFIILKLNENFLRQNGFSNFYKFLSDFNYLEDKDTKYSFTGGLVLDFEEAQSVVNNASKAGILSITIVCFILWLAFRNIYVIISLFFSIVCGLSITLGLTTLFVGSLNIISVAFAVLFIGISVDFGIQYFSRFQENLNSNVSETLKTTSKYIFKTLVIVTLTSMAGFLAFIPTSYVGLSELGIISSIGLGTGLVLNLLLFPSLLILFNTKTNLLSVKNNKENIFFTIVSSLYNFKKITLSIFFLIIMISLIFLNKTSFDFDPMKLKDQNSQSVILAYKLMEKNPSSDYTISLVGRNLDVKKLNELSEKNLIKGFYNIDKINYNDELTEQISYLQFLLDNKNGQFNSKYQEFSRFISLLKEISLLDIPKISNTTKNLNNYLENNQLNFNDFQKTFFSKFSIFIDDIVASLNTEVIDEKNIPPYFFKKYKSQNGIERIEVFPSEDVKEIKNLKKFVTLVRSYFPNSSGMPIVQLEAGKIVIDSFIFAFSLSFAFLLLFSFIVFRSLLFIFLSVLPLILSTILVSLIMVFLKINLNFANMIALPLLFSLGSSYSIYILKRSRDLGSIDLMLKSNTPNAVFFSAITTISSFGTLSFSTHYGTSSMGVLLFISLLVASILCVVFLPFLMKCLKISFQK